MESKIRAVRFGSLQRSARFLHSKVSATVDDHPPSPSSICRSPRIETETDLRQSFSHTSRIEKKRKYTIRSDKRVLAVQIQVQSPAPISKSMTAVNRWLSRLDYCSSFFACSSQSTLHRLQRVQDAAARLLCGASARTHAPPLTGCQCRAEFSLNCVP